MNKNQHDRRAQSLNPGISASEIERKWRRYQEELEIMEMMESARAFQAVVAVASSGGGGSSQTSVPVEPDIVTLVTEINGEEGEEGTFYSYIYSSTGYIGVVWWDSEIPQIAGDGVPENQITISKNNNGTPRDVTFYSCDADGIRTGTMSNVDVVNDQLTSLDVSKCLGLAELNCYGNSLETLDVSGLSFLEELRCNYNSLESISIANLPSLTYLDCGNNLLTSLDFSGTPSLGDLYSEYNLLTSLNVSGLPLLWLDCYNNSIASLDVSSLTLLEGLGCNDNLLTSLDASGLSLLTYFNCDYNLLLTSLNISECPLLIDLSPNGTDSLVYVDASGSGLTSFSLSGLFLTYLNLSGCPLTTFVVEGLYDSGVEFLTTLILSGCTSLVDFEASYFPVLNSVDLSGCTALTGSLSLGSRVFDGSPVETLSYAGCTGITGFEVDGSIMQQYLKSFNCSGCSALTTLALDNCDILETVYLTNCSILSSITISNSNISSINLSGLDLLANLRLNGNSLTSIDISSNLLINNLELQNTLLSSLNISTLRSTGAQVDCEPSPITSIDATGITVLNMYMRNCSMSSSALNSFFTSLGNADAGAGYSNQFFIYGNPGTETCDTTIATAKGWTVNTTTP